METISFSNLWSSLQANMGDMLPTILSVLAILIIGWFIALILSAAVRRGFGALKLNQRVSGTTGSGLNIEKLAGKITFWIVMLVTLVAVFSRLDMGEVSEPLNALTTQVFGFLPKLLSAAALGLVAWVLGTLAKVGSSRALAATSLDDRLSAEAGMESFSNNIGNILFWLIILLFLPAILGTLELGGMLEPVQAMIDKILGFLPNMFAAAVIGFVGWLVAKILRGLTSSVLASTGVNRWGMRAGIKTSTSLSSMGGLIVFVLVFVPSLIAALNALGVEAISGPATAMLQKMMDAIPNIISAGVILTVTYFVARFIAITVSMILNGSSFDELPAKLGLNLDESVMPSILAGKLILFFAMLFATVEAANMLGFEQVGTIVSMFIEFAGHILLGGVILVAGFWLANLAHDTIIKVSGTDSSGVAKLAKFAIMGLVTAMGLGAMGIADDVVNLAFGLTLGAIAVAVALSFGLGGREAAGKQMEYWFSKMRRD